MFSFSRWYPTRGAAPLASFDAPSWRRGLLELLGQRSRLDRDRAGNVPEIATRDPLLAVLMAEIGLLSEGDRSRLRAQGRSFGSRELFIEPDGTVHLSRYASTPIGSLRSQSLERIWESSRNDTLHEGDFERCSPCDNAAFCCGQPDDALLREGRLTAPDRLCWSVSPKGESV